MQARFALAVLAAALSGAVMPAAAQSADGVVNIDQSAALAGAVTHGDTAGYPVTLSKSGTYRLTSNLVVPAGKDGIVVQPGISAVIDLNGYQIIGPAVCSLSSYCYDSAGTAGVRSGSESSSLTVRNGRIRGFSDAGISGRDHALIDTPLGDMTVEDVWLWNNRNGVYANRLIGQRIHAKGNAASGIYAEYGTVQQSFAIANTTGIYVRRGRVSDSSATQNQSAGFVGGTSVLLHYNTATGNTVNFINGLLTSTNLAF